MEVQGVAPERVDAVEAASVVSGQVDASGNLVLTTKGGQQKNAGSVVKPLFSWPVGSIYIGVTSTNPADLFGGGTWERFGQGRVLVSQDSTQAEFDQPLEVGGAKTHRLTSSESGVPAHNHSSPPHDHGVTNAGTGGEATVGTVSGLVDLGSGVNSAYAPLGQVYAVDVIAASVTINNNAAQDAANAHNNLQPYIVVYMWRRTA